MILTAVENHSESKASFSSLPWEIMQTRTAVWLKMYYSANRLKIIKPIKQVLVSLFFFFVVPANIHAFVTFYSFILALTFSKLLSKNPVRVREGAHDDIPAVTAEL